MPWLTPDNLPEEDACRPLFVPADPIWLALVSGALTELTKPYNWQEFGSLTVQQTVDRMQEVIDSYYDTACATCTTPGGYRSTRISPTGHLQQLNASGEWEDATDDYAIPAPTARTEGTAPDQNCLAAKNATNVLETLYENISASYASELSTDEAITAFIAAAVAAVGFEFAPVTWSIAAGGFVFFEALFKALEYITADLWTDDFSKEFECLLLSCATNDSGVVTFDWDCVNAGLLKQTNNMGLSEVQMRLYVQIGFILHFIGGIDGLNLAARTTDITNDDCTFCDTCPDEGVDWCETILDQNANNDGSFTIDNGDNTWTGNWGLFLNAAPPALDYLWEAVVLTRSGVEVAHGLQIYRVMPAGTYTDVRFDWAVNFGSFTTDIREFVVSIDGTDMVNESTDGGASAHWHGSITGAPTIRVAAIVSYRNDGSSGGGGASFKNLVVEGTGTKPIF
jgi:hypothetical protein